MLSLLFDGGAQLRGEHRRPLGVLGGGRFGRVPRGARALLPGRLAGGQRGRGLPPRQDVGHLPLAERVAAAVGLVLGGARELGVDGGRGEVIGGQVFQGVPRLDGGLVVSPVGLKQLSTCWDCRYVS